MYVNHRSTLMASPDFFLNTQTQDDNFFKYNS